MPKAIVEQSTWLKARSLASVDLTDSEKIFMEAGKNFAVTQWYPARNQHLRLVLASPLVARDGKTKLQEVFAYDPHIKVEGEDAEKVIKLPVRYSSQLNNDTNYFGPGWRQCNTTSHSMLVDFVLKGKLTEMAKQQKKLEPESVYMGYVAKHGDTIDHSAHTKALRELGIDSYFSYTLSAKDLLMSLAAGIPVAVGFAYKGSGHICLIVGHSPKEKVWFVHDPYGTRYGATDSYDVGVGGVYDHYSYDVMQQIFFDQGHDSGWGRVVTRIEGKPTGLPAGL